MKNIYSIKKRLKKLMKEDTSVKNNQSSYLFMPFQDTLLLIKVNTYPENNLAIKLYCKSSGTLDFWGSLTVNLPGIRQHDCAFINIREQGDLILAWIAENQLGKPTGQIRESDGFSYPEYLFSPTKLRVADPEGYTYYVRCQKGELGRRYERLYIALQRIKKQRETFRYTDYSGWRCVEHSSDKLPLWIEAEDPALQLRCSIIHKGAMMKLSALSFDESGCDLPDTHQTFYCRTKEDLSTHLLALFQYK